VRQYSCLYLQVPPRHTLCPYTTLFRSLFKRLEREREEIMLEVKITKKSNPPATFITSIIGINTIGDQMNVLFMGKIVDQRQSKIEETLRTLIQKGYQGEELLDRFKQLI